jgi:hypothetical protein
MDAFGYRSFEEQQRINKRLIERVRLLEQRAARLRVANNKRIIGRERLVNQVLDVTYRPKRSGRRMWCLSEKRSIRVTFIRFFKELMHRARAVRQRWKIGDIAVPYPPGLYPPSMPKLADVLGY